MFILLGLVVNRSLPGNCMIADNPVRIGTIIIYKGQILDKG